MPARFRPRQRLRTRRDFDRVFRRGQRLDGRLFTLVVAPNDLGEHRLGLAVSRRVGSAVTRNRAKRVVREAFRQLPCEPGASFDIVVLAKAELAVRCTREVHGELAERLRRAARRLARTAGPPAHPAG